uniref:uncharacterized protein n=1 Tax=Lonchura striata TaxID=40157 RepID=UPI000B4C474B|nr:uncharacterized protein LOC110472147 [Lonchura striata domestica]
MENGREGRSGAEPGDPPNRGEAPPARPARPGLACRGSPPRHSRFPSKYPRWEKRRGKNNKKQTPKAAYSYGEKKHQKTNAEEAEQTQTGRRSHLLLRSLRVPRGAAGDQRPRPAGARGGSGGENPPGRPAGTARGEPPAEGARPGRAAGLPPGAAAATTCRRPAAAAAPRGAAPGRPPAPSGPPASGPRRPDLTPARRPAPGLPRRPGPEAELPRGGRLFPRQHPAPPPARREPHAPPREKVNENTRCFPGARSSIIFQITPAKK